MTTSLRDLLAAVPGLDDPGEPFTFAVEGETIVGTWDVVKATSLYPTEITHLRRGYSITVELDEAKHEYDWVERESSTEASAGSGGLSFARSGFRGKTMSRSFSWELGGVNKTDDGLTVGPVAYTFSTARIKDPLLSFLEEHGWTMKKGFLNLNRLFRR